MREGPPPARCTAANPCGLSGQVVDETGAPIAGASVTMGREVVKTDEGGQFSLRGDDGLAATVEATTPDGRRGPARVGGEGDSVTLRSEGLPPPVQTPPEPPQPQPVT